MLGTHLGDRCDSDVRTLAFTTGAGTPLRSSNFRRTVWQPAIAAIGQEGLRVHDLRHTCASLLIATDAHPHYVKEHPGHSSIRVTMDVYGHLYDDKKDDIALRLEDLRNARLGLPHPHRSLGRATPAAKYTMLPKATPGHTSIEGHYRIRHDIVGDTGTVTLRHGGILHHVGIGRTHARTHIIMLIENLDIRIVNPTTGELLRRLTLDPTRNYQPQDPQHKKTPKP